MNIQDIQSINMTNGKEEATVQYFINFVVSQLSDSKCQKSLKGNPQVTQQAGHVYAKGLDLCTTCNSLYGRIRESKTAISIDEAVWLAPRVHPLSQPCSLHSVFQYTSPPTIKIKFCQSDTFLISQDLTVWLADGAYV